MNPLHLLWIVSLSMTAGLRKETLWNFYAV